MAARVDCRADLTRFADALSDPDALAEMLDGMVEGVYLVDTGRIIRFWNRAAEEISGYEAAEVIGRRCYEEILRHVDATGKRLSFGKCPLAHTMRDGQPREAQVWLLHRDGHRVPALVRTRPVIDRDGTVVGAIEVFADRSHIEATEARIGELERLALSDPLTRLPNRRFLEVALAGRLAECRRQGRTLGVIFVDVDGFKSVNELYGHELGDRLLQVVADTLAGALRGYDLVTRFGDDEFVVLLPDIDPLALADLCDRLRALVAASCVDLPGGDVLNVTLSAGATLARRYDTPEAVLARADTLLFEAKRAGGDRVVLGAAPVDA
jgi:diguanylate cyclase (GGDEF)-like protein/PAS domain S-box-containing protein